MIELTMQVSDFDYTETLDNFLPDLIRILSEGEDVNPLIRKAVGASPELSKKIVKHSCGDEPEAEGSAYGEVSEHQRPEACFAGERGRRQERHCHHPRQRQGRHQVNPSIRTDADILRRFFIDAGRKSNTV